MRNADRFIAAERIHALGAARALFAVFILFRGMATPAAETASPTEGLRSNPAGIHAFVGGDIVVRPGETIEDGVLVTRDGVIEAVGKDGFPPAGARVWDCAGLTLYPGLIAAYSEAGVGDPVDGSDGNRHWNEHVRPERDVLGFIDPGSGDFDSLRKIGFTAIHAAPKDGIVRGRSAVIDLSSAELRERVLIARAAQRVSVETGGSWTEYPSSRVGAVALIRQAFLDAQWHREARSAHKRNPAQEPPEFNLSLDTLSDLLETGAPVYINAGDEHEFLRARKIANEFGLNAVFLGGGYEYRNTGLYGNLGNPLIVPVDFPKPPKVEHPDEALDIRLTALRHWEMAPSNPAMLEEAGVPFVLVPHGLPSAGDFPGRVREAIGRGLSEEDALAALTARPAALLGVEDELGSLEAGKRGHIVVMRGPLFGKDSKVMEVWIGEERHVVNRRPAADPRGVWSVSLPRPAAAPLSATLEIEGTPEALKASLTVDATPAKVPWIDLVETRIAFQLQGGEFPHDGVARFSGVVEDGRMGGNAAMPDGETRVWSAVRIDSHEDGEPEPAKADEPFVPVSRMVYPPNAYGREAPPEAPEWVFVDNAILWTCGPEGVIENGDLLIHDGKIDSVGVDLTPPDGALRIDGTDRHVTPGLIDCHSHTAIFSDSINEGGQAVTAEVRIKDMVDAFDINLYRQLAGGRTLSHLLHGSANPIGGQNALIKLRWGELPEGLFEDRAPGTIKFALGENVKRSNWDDPTNRYPKTRMGVEQIIRDRFMAALDYQRRWDAYRRSAEGRPVIPPRRDLELETLLEIVRGERWIHCHAYRQDEILMLMRLAEDFGFRVGTFQHILEGYKVADVMAEHGAGGSAFSDWWAYKFEVIDAIPHAAALMRERGVLVSLNSDDDELSRRMNTEAAKAVKYGGVPEEEALKLVTINAAKQLRVDRYTGSLEAGKDADIAVWNGHPLSSYTRCEQTWIDGRKYFDAVEDREMMERVQSERARLMQKLLGADEGETDEKDDGRDESDPEWREFWFASAEDHMDARGHCACMAGAHDHP